jgi:hypothetical protein
VHACLQPIESTGKQAIVHNDSPNTRTTLTGHSSEHDTTVHRGRLDTITHIRGRLTVTLHTRHNLVLSHRTSTHDHNDEFAFDAHTIY